MTIGRALSVVRIMYIAKYPVPEARQAAFLTQTVTLEDQTTVKFEIW